MKKTILLLSLLFITASAQPSIEKISNYNQWGWDAIVMKNDLITLATVPAIGGRIMQYDLGALPSIFINSAEFGKTYTPANNNQWHNFGGFKNWPAPQSKWNAGGWPPPPILDYGTYLIEDTVRTDDSVWLSVSSNVEQWLAPGIRFKRKATLYEGTSRIKMEQTVVNEGNKSVSWSMWDITQSIVHHEGQTDYQNYWVYFPINPSSHYGTSGVYFPNSSTAWKGEVAPGVYGVQFKAEGKKIFADPHNGWIAYAVKTDSVVFAKLFEVLPGAEYPDDGARIAVYISGNPAYVEVEVTSPIVELADSGSSYTFIENWFAAKARSPILDADSVGVISKRMLYDNDSHILSAIYGVFYEGSAQIVFKNSEDSLLEVHGKSHTVSPLNEFQLIDTIGIPKSAVSVEIHVRNSKDEFVGVLERADVSQLTTSVKELRPIIASDFRLDQNYPNPFNGGTVINFFCPKPTHGSLKIYDLMGREIAVLESGFIEAGEHRHVWNPEHIASGMYFAQLELNETLIVRKMMYLR